MFNAAVDRNFTDLFLTAITEEINKSKDILVERTSDRNAGRVQGLIDARLIMQGIVQQANDAQAKRTNPQHQASY